MAFKPQLLIGHWTGVASYNITQAIKNDYHYVVDEKGAIAAGVSSNLASKYGTAGMNSITLQIAMAGGVAPAKLTPIQCETFFKLCAEKLKTKGLDEKAFLTHGEVGELCRNKINGKKPDITNYIPWNNYLQQNIGKWDLQALPTQYTPDLSTIDKKDLYKIAKAYGDKIREKIRWYLLKV